MKPSTLLGALVLGSAVVAGPVSAAVVVTFVPGVYELADTIGAAPVDQLTVSVSGGVASFVLSGADNETFSVPDMSTPAGVVFGDSPYYDSASLPAVSYSPVTYPYLTFYPDVQFGGLTIGDQPGDSGSNLVNLFRSDVGTGQVFTITGVPEPATWSMLLVGLAAVGYGLRRKTKAAISIEGEGMPIVI